MAVVRRPMREKEEVDSEPGSPTRPKRRPIRIRTGSSNMRGIDRLVLGCVVEFVSVMIHLRSGFRTDHSPHSKGMFWRPYLNGRRYARRGGIKKLDRKIGSSKMIVQVQSVSGLITSSASGRLPSASICESNPNRISSPWLMARAPRPFAYCRCCPKFSLPQFTS
jgi:hypothetical protein